MSWRTVAKAAIPYLWTLAPTYGMERLANYYFLGKDPAFYVISGWRVEVFIICTLVGSAAAGAYLRSFRLAAAAQIASIASLLTGVYFLCDPRVCYSSAPDGLEPIRVGLFLCSVAVAGVALGLATRRRVNVPRLEAALVGSAGFVAVAWYPMIFTFAGAKLLFPFDPVATLAVLFLTAFATSAGAAVRLGTRTASIVPTAALVVTLVLSSGIALAYLSTLVYEILLIAAVTVVGGAAGAVVASHEGMEWRRVTRVAPSLFAVSVGLVLLMTLAVIPDAVSGVEPETSQGPLSMGIPVYSGAFMDTPQGHSDGVGIVVSFAKTDPAAIQGSNFLAGGIGIHSAGCCVDGIDYAYRFDLYLFHDGNESLVASAWEVCDDNAACGGHSWKTLLFSEQRQIGLALTSADVSLRMIWAGGSVEWLYSTGGAGFANFTSYRVSGQENHDFNTGVSAGVSLSSQKAAYFYQFGVMSRYPIGPGAWKVSFNCPSTLSEGTWTCIDHAATLAGHDSYWKVIWRWGEDYPNVAVSATGSQSVLFEYSSTGSGDFQTLW